MALLDEMLDDPEEMEIEDMPKNEYEAYLAAYERVKEQGGGNAAAYKAGMQAAAEEARRLHGERIATRKDANNSWDTNF